MKRSNAFTFFELIVALAIIAFLASLVAAGIKIARGGPGVSVYQHFEADVYHSLGTNLAAWWKLDEGSGSSAFDSSGNGNTAVLVNSPEWTQDTPGKDGYALMLDGKKEYARAGASPSTRDYESGVTISLWFKPSSMDGSTRCLFMQNNGAAYLDLCLVSNQIRMETNLAQAAYSSPSIKANAWHHIVAVYDPTQRTQQARLYVNGALDVKATLTFNPSNTGTIYIGSDDNGNTFAGTLDDIRLYTKAFTAAEASRLYAEGVPEHRIAVR